MRKTKFFRLSIFMRHFISAYASQLVFMGLDFAADKLRMNAESRIMVELYTWYIHPFKLGQKCAMSTRKIKK